MRIHFIAIGGSAMHNLALALHDKGHHVTGSDDEIYEPSKSRLAKAGILPVAFGWFPELIDESIEAIILGMHARPNNPELLKAQELGLKIYSYPEFVANQSKKKKRVVIAGSHGKTTTTSIILHALSKEDVDYDYLVGAQLKGFDRMVQLTDAEIIVLEGDEYLSSPIDRRPKMMHYDPDIAVITGIAWDHINVFPTIEDYVKQFSTFVSNMKKGSILYYYENDKFLQEIIMKNDYECEVVAYGQVSVKDDAVIYDGRNFPIKLIGNHNMQNIKAANKVCEALGIASADFFAHISDFEGANRRLQTIRNGNAGNGFVFLDFAHAPSKLKATTRAIKDWYGDAPLTAVFELHTFSSLNKDFIPHYSGAMEAADKAIVLYSEHTLKMKKMPPLNENFVRESFGRDDLMVFTDPQKLKSYLENNISSSGNVLLMSSGNFGGIDIHSIYG